jgi:hypothetical protein
MNFHPIIGGTVIPPFCDDRVPTLAGRAIAFRQSDGASRRRADDAGGDQALV